MRFLVHLRQTRKVVVDDEMVIRAVTTPIYSGLVEVSAIKADVCVPYVSQGHHRSVLTEGALFREPLHDLLHECLVNFTRDGLP